MFDDAGVADYGSTKDGSPARRATAIQAECDQLFPSFIPKAGWPATSPDLDVLDFYVWGCVRKKVNELNPATLVELKVAIDRCVGAIPPNCLQAAIDGFYKRRKLCVEQGGRTFKHVLKSKAAREVQYPPREGAPSGDAEMDIADEPVNGEGDGYLSEDGEDKNEGQ